MQHKPLKETTTNQNAKLYIPVTVGASTTYSLKEQGGRSSGQTIKPRGSGNAVKLCLLVMSEYTPRVSPTFLPTHELNKDNNREQRQPREEHTNSLSYGNIDTSNIIQTKQVVFKTISV